MKLKKILDIRLFEEIEPGKRIPGYAGKLYEMDREPHLISTRFARKLRELEFITGEFDHLYIVMSPFLEDQKVVESERRADKWLRYFYVGVSTSDFNGKTNQEKEQYMIELISSVLIHIALNDDHKNIVRHVRDLLLRLGSEIEITHVSKETSKYKVTIVYQIRPLNKKSQAIIEYHDLTHNVRRKSVFLELNMYEDLYFLVSSMTLKNGVLCLKPRVSETAKFHIKSYQTPITMKVDDIQVVV